MDWLINAFWAKIGWALGEVVIGGGVASVMLIVFFALQIPRTIKQRKCAHQRFFETGSCNAVCQDCGKNLGFIGSWREKQRLAAR